MVMGALILFLLAVSLPTALGIMVVRHVDQKARDHNRKTYRLAFPADLDAERVAAWVRATTGTLRVKPLRLTGTPTLTFEMWATNRGIEHRLKVPWQHADFIISQLRSLVPGVRVTPEDESPRSKWTRAVELGLTHSTRQLRILSPTDLSASLLASMQTLEQDEALLLQWVVTPAVPVRPPIYKEAKTHHVDGRLLTRGNLASRDEVMDRREKLAEPNVLALLRVAASAASPPRADHLVNRVRASLAAVRGPTTRFHKRLVTKAKLQDRIDHARAPLNFPMQLSASELTALIAWPIGNPFVPGLPATMSRHIPANESVPRTGRVIGRSNFPGNERPIAIGYTDALKHMHVAGPTGVGKTVLLANMLRQDILNGYGVILIESKGDLFHAALDYVPSGRIKDVVVLDVNDTARPVGFNILQQGDPRVVIDELGSLFDQMYDSKSVWTREVLYHGLRTLVSDPKLTFIDLAPLLVPMSEEEGVWRDSVIRGLTDKEMRNFWQRFENQPRASQDRITQPVMDRIWQLNARPEIRNIIGQSESSFQMADVIRGNKILLVNLTNLPRETSSLTGTLVMNSLWHAVKTTRAERPSFLYLDEFQDYINLPVDPEDMLAKARGFGLGMVLAHQHLDQLPLRMKQAVLTNARSKVIFQTSANDAQAMSREFGSTVDDQDFIHLGKYEAIARVETGDGVSSPFTVSTNEPAKGFGLAQRVRYNSGQSYGRPVDRVEAEIEARRSTPKKTSKRRPKLSGEGW